MKPETIIRKLKGHIATKGYYENLGQKELRQYSEFAFNKYSYSEAARLVTALTNQIDSLEHNQIEAK